MGQQSEQGLILHQTKQRQHISNFVVFANNEKNEKHCKISIRKMTLINTINEELLIEP